MSFVGIERPGRGGVENALLRNVGVCSCSGGAEERNCRQVDTLKHTDTETRPYKHNTLPNTLTHKHTLTHSHKDTQTFPIIHLTHRPDNIELMFTEQLVDWEGFFLFVIITNIYNRLYTQPQTHTVTPLFHLVGILFPLYTYFWSTLYITVHMAEYFSTLVILILLTSTAAI